MTFKTPIFVRFFKTFLFLLKSHNKTSYALQIAPTSLLQQKFAFLQKLICAFTYVLHEFLSFGESFLTIVLHGNSNIEPIFSSTIVLDDFLVFGEVF